jgi:hypothetical protein
MDTSSHPDLPTDIQLRVQHDFGPEEALVICQLLVELKAEDPVLFVDRILRCLVFVARGDFKKFSDGVALARLDYRDLIVQGEYDANWQRVRSLVAPFPN